MRDRYVSADIGCTVCQRSHTLGDISGACLTSIRTTSCVMSFVRGFQLESSKPHCREAERGGRFLLIPSTRIKEGRS